MAQNNSNNAVKAKDTAKNVGLAAQNAADKVFDKASPKLNELKNSIETSRKAWDKVQQQLLRFNDLTEDEKSQMIAAKLQTATSIMIKVINQLKDDPRLKEETKKLFCLLGESFKEALVIISDALVEMTPEATEAIIKLMKSTVPAVNAALTASIGTLKELLFASVPPAAAVYNLIDTGQGVATQAALLSSKLNESTMSFSKMQEKGLDVFEKQTPAINSIMDNVGKMMTNVASLTEIMADATNLPEIKKPTMPTAPAVPKAPLPPTAPTVGGGYRRKRNKTRKYRKRKRNRSRKYLRGGSDDLKSLMPPSRPIPKDPDFNQVLAAWGVVGFAPFDILDLQQEADKRNAQLEKDLTLLKNNVPVENIQDVEYAVGITQKYMNKKGGRKMKRKTRKRTLRKKHRKRRRRKKKTRRYRRS